MFIQQAIYFLILTFLGFFEFAGRIFPSIPIPIWGNHFPLFLPAAMLIWTLKMSTTDIIAAPRFLMSEFDIMIIVTIIIWTAMELARGIFYTNAFYFRFIVDLIWTYLVYCTLKCFDQKKTFRRKVLRIFIKVSFFISFAYLILYFIYLNTSQSDAPNTNFSQLYNNNALSYIIVFAMAIFLMEKPLLFKNWLIYFAVIGTTISTSLLTGSRGGVVIIGIIILIYIVRLFISKKMRMVDVVLILITGSYLIFYYEQINIILHSTLNSFIINNISWQEEIGALGGNTASIYVRYNSVVKGYYEWLENPLFGIGVDGLDNIDVLGSGIHSYFPSILYSYGIIGALPIGILWIYLGFRGWMLHGVAAVVYIIALSCILMLTQDLKHWLGIGFYLILSGKSINRNSKGRSAHPQPE